MEYESNSWEETFQIGYEMGQKAKCGEIYCLYGELGVGKTVFSQGFAKGLDIKANVTSPTFTLVQEYQGGRMPLYHFDVYRISDVSEMYDIGYEEYFFGEGVCIIEWPEMIKEILPDNVKRVYLSRSLSKDYDYRKITVHI